jgi:hypothetical protein
VREIWELPLYLKETYKLRRIMVFAHAQATKHHKEEVKNGND